MDASTVSVTIGGIPASVSYAGLVGAGLDQINVTVPSLPAGDQEVLVAIDSYPTQSSVMLPVGIR